MTVSTSLRSDGGATGVGTWVRAHQSVHSPALAIARRLTVFGCAGVHRGPLGDGLAGVPSPGRDTGGGPGRRPPGFHGTDGARFRGPRRPRRRHTDRTRARPAFTAPKGLRLARARAEPGELSAHQGPHQRRRDPPTGGSGRAPTSPTPSRSHADWTRRGRAGAPGKSPGDVPSVAAPGASGWARIPVDLRRTVVWVTSRLCRGDVHPNAARLDVTEVRGWLRAESRQPLPEGAIQMLDTITR